MPSKHEPNSHSAMKKLISCAALSLCCLAAVTGCARPDLGQPTYRISREESVAILRAGLPADSDQDQDGIPDSLDPAPHGSGLSDGGSQL